MLVVPFESIFWMNGNFVKALDWYIDPVQVNPIQVGVSLLALRSHTKEHYFSSPAASYARLALNANLHGFKLINTLPEFLETLKACRDKFRNSDYLVTVIADKNRVAISATPHIMETKLREVDFILDSPTLLNTNNMEPLVRTSEEALESLHSDLITYSEGMVHLPEYPKSNLTLIVRSILETFGSGVKVSTGPRTIKDLARAEAVMFLSDRYGLSLANYPAPALNLNGDPSTRLEFVNQLFTQLHETLRGKSKNHAKFFT